MSKTSSKHREWKLLVDDEGVPMGGGVLGGKWNEETTVPERGEIVRAQEVPPGYVGLVVREDLVEQARVDLGKLMPGQAVPWESAFLEALELPDEEQGAKVESLLSEEDRGRLADAEYENANPEYAERARQSREHMLTSLYHAIRQVRTGEVLGFFMVTTRQKGTGFTGHGVPPTAPGILLIQDVAAQMRADYCDREFNEVEYGKPIMGVIADKPSDDHFKRELKLSREDEPDA